jgi:hypothetical protein
MSLRFMVYYYARPGRCRSRSSTLISRASAFSFQGLEFIKALKNFEPQTNLRFENTKMQKEGIKRCFIKLIINCFSYTLRAYLSKSIFDCPGEVRICTERN